MISKALIVLAVATVALGNSIPFVWGPQAFPATGKIVGGTQATAGQIPWQVSIQTAGGSQSCGGSIISANWIVTAAHCSQINPANYRVRSGTLTYGSGGTVHSITRIVSHASYNPNNLHADISVWQINPPFVMGTNTRAITLPAQSGTPPTGNVRVSGWGTTSSGGPISPNLLWVEVPMVSNATCNQNYANYGGIQIDQICAGQAGRDSCQGDSGGPLFSNGDSTLRGIVSWGVGCAQANFPGVYTMVSYYRDWIRTQTGV